MNALALVFDDEFSARAKAGALAATWHVVLSGPDDYLEVDKNGTFTTTVQGTWTVLASKNAIETITT